MPMHSGSPGSPHFVYEKVKLVKFFYAHAQQESWKPVSEYEKVRHSENFLPMHSGSPRSPHFVYEKVRHSECFLCPCTAGVPEAVISHIFALLI
jgi:hypothetical protein